MRLLLALCAVAGALALSSLHKEADLQTQFIQFAIQHGKAYASPEETALRFDIFKNNLAIMAKHNAHAAKHGWEMGVNEFSDLSPEEFERLYLHNNFGPSTGPLRSIEGLGRLGDDIDWRNKSAVGTVKNQGATGQPGAYVTADAVGGYRVTNDKLAYVELSWTQVADNCGEPGVNPANGIQYAAVRGLCTQNDYVKVKDACKALTQPMEVDVGENEPDLQHMLQKTPTTVLVEVGKDFQNYKSGVFSGPCGQGGMFNHALLIVGGSDSGDGYWIAKNSFGTTWGEQGYIRLIKGKNICNIGFQTAIPIAD